MNINPITRNGQNEQFVMPTFFTSKSVVFLVLNILTLGIYGAAETVTKQRRVKELKITQDCLKSQVSDLERKWDDLEQKFSEKLKKLENLMSNSIDLQQIEALKAEKAELDKFVEDESLFQCLEVNLEAAASLTKVALGTIAFIGQLFANVFTVGLYGVYRNYTLKNHITILECKNELIQKQFEEKKVRKLHQIQTAIAVVKQTIDFKDQLEVIRGTDPGTARQEMLNAQQEMLNAQQEAQTATQAYSNLQIQQATLEQHLEALSIENTAAAVREQTAQMELSHIKKQVISLGVEKQLFYESQISFNLEKEGLQREIFDLREQLYENELKAVNIQGMRQEIDRLKNTNARGPEAQQLMHELGPVVPRYIPRAEDGQTMGFFDLKVPGLVKGLDDNQFAQKIEDPKWIAYTIANEKYNQKMDNEVEGQAAQDFEGSLEKISQMGLEGKKIKIENKEFDPAWVIEALKYQNRYKEQRSAGTIIQASFEFAFSELLSMASEEHPKIKITDSEETSATPGANAVYHYMILDLIKGGKVQQLIGCDRGLALAVNEHVWLLPSNPEKVMRFVKMPDGSYAPKVVLRYNQRDDFTSPELSTQTGVDCLGAKWILMQLSQEEQEHLFNLLMSSVIEDDHRDLQATRAYMANSTDSRVKLVQTAYDLIQDMASAMQKKFEGTELAALWKKNAKGSGDAFIKESEIPPDVKAIEDVDFTQMKSNKVSEWKLDLDVLGDKRPGDTKPRQPEFAKLVEEAHFKYQTAFKYMDNKDFHLLQNPIEDTDELTNLDWGDLDSQAEVSHQMIGNDVYGQGCQGCLFSNLLAVIMNDKKDLTVDNVLAFRKAMATYLDKLQEAKSSWLSLQQSVAEEESEQENYAKLKEMAELTDIFEKGIQDNHTCTIQAYQAWLRGESYATYDLQGAAKLDVNDLTPFEIQLAAYTIGVKIGLLLVSFRPSNSNSRLDYRAKVDKNGRIVPKQEYYGPNTKEFLLIATPNNSYYGVFPKLQIDKNSEFYRNFYSNINMDQVIDGEETSDSREYNALLDLAIYWGSINDV